jgi:hypothetical protein
VSTRCCNTVSRVALRRGPDAEGEAALSAAAGASDDDDDGLSGGEGSGEARQRRMLLREEVKLEKEIVRMVGNGVVRRRRC